jgi:carboxyl-terminal processing protease
MTIRTRVILLLLFLAIASLAGYRLYNGIKATRGVAAGTDQIKLLKEVMGLVKKHYVDQVDDKKLVQGAIDGMLSKLDPHSSFMTPEPYKEMRINMSGSFGGLGIEINIKNEKLTVISPIEDTPAWRAGIKPNDYIWKIDSKLTKGLSINQAVNLMRGEKGTRVTLHIVREGQKKPLVFPLVRDIIKTKSMKSRTLVPGYGYIRIIQFQERTGEDFDRALRSLHAENPDGLKGLVLDLRNNPGGLVDTAAQVADRFVGEGKDDGTIVTMKGRIQSSSISHFAKVGTKEPHYPIVILINGGSASASEILAGALQDHHRAIIMGTQSYGKGSVQSVIPLRGGYGLKLTTALYYTPKGRSIQARGITPDIIVGAMDLAKKPKADGKDKQEDFGDIREKDLENHLEKDGTKAKEAPAPKAEPIKAPPLSAPGDDLATDYQLSRALEMLKGLDVFTLMAKDKGSAKPAAAPGAVAN